MKSVAQLVNGDVLVERIARLSDLRTNTQFATRDSERAADFERFVSQHGWTTQKLAEALSQLPKDLEDVTERFLFDRTTGICRKQEISTAQRSVVLLRELREARTEIDIGGVSFSPTTEGRKIIDTSWPLPAALVSLEHEERERMLKGEHPVQVTIDRRVTGVTLRMLNKTWIQKDLSKCFAFINGTANDPRARVLLQVAKASYVAIVDGRADEAMRMLEDTEKQLDGLAKHEFEALKGQLIAVGTALGDVEAGEKRNKLVIDKFTNAFPLEQHIRAIGEQLDKASW
jgi:hypothetical protein